MYMTNPIVGTSTLTAVGVFFVCLSFLQIATTI